MSLTSVDVSALPRIETWDELFIEIAKVMSRKSKDPSTRTGCVVVDPKHRIRSAGYNGFPQKVEDRPERYADRQLKYKLTAHCDANAVYSAAMAGIPLDGCTMYLTGPPCSECTKAIIQAGIVEVVWPWENPFEAGGSAHERWKSDLDLAAIMWSEARLKIRRV